jgi:hypothetical protein
MKRLQLYKAASDFAFANFQLTGADMAIASAEAFKKAGFDNRDWQYFNSMAVNLCQQFIGMDSQLAPSAQAYVNKPKAAAAPASQPAS